ncbi:MAG: hypothetical protein BMS9Abin17_1174 [Acidimicrobiia bacterium]|nr:MAG: hypothetical protein BMS9Abin17_1174 [Acidimicrobiia bacterium]
MTTTTMTTMTTMMKTTTDSSTPQRRSSSRRAVFAVVAAATLLVIAGCTSTDETASASASDTTVAAEAGDSASTTTSTTPLDPRALLTAALDNYGEGYQFESVAEVGDEEAVSVTGVVIDASAQMEVVSGDGTASYITTPEASWIRVEGGEWQNLDAPGPVEPPLAALASPTSISMIGSSNDGVTIVGTYDGSLFTSDETVELEILIKDGLLLSASYTTANAKVSTTFGPLDGATIDTPAPSA